MLINAFEDAHHFHQDLYLLYVDFSSAFNLVDHDKLLCIMYDLGLPEDIIDVVRDLYYLVLPSTFPVATPQPSPLPGVPFKATHCPPFSSCCTLSPYSGGCTWAAVGTSLGAWKITPLNPPQESPSRGCTNMPGRAMSMTLTP